MGSGQWGLRCVCEDRAEAFGNILDLMVQPPNDLNALDSISNVERNQGIVRTRGASFECLEVGIQCLEYGLLLERIREV